MIKLISLKTYLSRRRMQHKLEAQMRDIKEIITEMNLVRDKYLAADRMGSNEKNYFKGWFDCCKWLIREK